MNDLSTLTRYFDEFIDETFKCKPILIAAFKNHERKNLCILNIQKELSKPVYATLIYDIKGLRECINTYARMFCFTVINQKEKSIKKNSILHDEFGNLVAKKATFDSPIEMPDGVIEVERHSERRGV